MSADDVTPEVGALADALFLAGVERGYVGGHAYRRAAAECILASGWLSQRDARIKAGALREAANIAISEDRGIPWDHDYDRATVAAWLGELADRIEGRA